MFEDHDLKAPSVEHQAMILVNSTQQAKDCVKHIKKVLPTYQSVLITLTNTQKKGSMKGKQKF